MKRCPIITDAEGLISSAQSLSQVSDSYLREYYAFMLVSYPSPASQDSLRLKSAESVVPSAYLILIIHLYLALILSITVLMESTVSMR